MTNQFPTIPSSCKLALILDCPDDKNLESTHLSSSAGRLLTSVLASHGVAASQCFIGYVSPVPGDYNSVAFDSPEVQSNLVVLRADLANYQPNCILALGRSAVRSVVPSIGRDTKDGFFVPIGDYRGSILMSDPDGCAPANTKVVICYPPGHIFISYLDLPLFRLDVGRACKQSKFPELRRKVRTLVVEPTVSQVEEYCNLIRQNKETISYDIEGYADNIGVTMISIARSDTDVMVIPFFQGGKHYWLESDEVRVWQALGGLLLDPAVTKVCQNGMYELFVLAWNHHMKISGVMHDTMFMHFELLPELEKSLALQTSIYTEEPYYKNERTSDDEYTKLVYNAKDSLVTHECFTAMQPKLAKVASSQSHYDFNRSLIPAVAYLNLRGVKFDSIAAARELEKTRTSLLPLSQELESLLGRKFNVKSVPDKQWLLYEFFGFTPYARYGRTTKEEVLLRYYARERHPILKKVIELVGLRTRVSDIEKLTCDADGRIRSNLNLVGASTSRSSSNSSSARVAYFTKTGILKWDFTGTNLQNVTKELRVCFVPDSPDYCFWQCDLSGADGWTVAADLAALGYPTMLDDYQFGIKPAKVLLLMLAEHEAGRDPGNINRLDRAEIKLRTKALVFPDHRDEYGRPGDWKYLCAKRVQHGTNYDMEPDKLAATIFKDSDGLIDLSTKEAGLYQYFYKLRYNPSARKEYIRRELIDKGYLQTASGFRRQFLGIRNRRDPDPSVVREALATEPQANTTFICNSALCSLWYDPSNRSPLDTLYIEPLLQIHDALAGQFPRAAVDFARERLHTYFKHPIRIHGIDIQIPFEGGFGNNWLDCHEGEI